LFWFQAIVKAIVSGEEKAVYNELINQMIADAWYMVSEYKLNLGPNDTLENLVLYAYGISKLKSGEKSEAIHRFLNDCKDKELIAKKRVLTLNVPYRLQAPFMPDVKGKAWEGRVSEVAERINRHERLMYYFSNISGLNSEIYFDKEWSEYIIANREIINGWIQFNMISYLQRRNPSVPGIANKIYPPEERKLEKVKKLWRTIIALQPTYDIYGGFELDKGDVSIDHFVPWSYVTHDELWNLHPTTRSINSKKSNSLPEWDLYFEKLAKTEYDAYLAAQTYAVVQTEYQKCLKEHVNDPDIMEKLYRKGMDRATFVGTLRDIVRPVYSAAINMGFDIWRYSA